MKARIQSVQQLKEVAARELKAELDQQISDALLDGAAQGMAYVMWVLEMNYGWKDKRLQKLFQEMQNMMDLGESWLKPLEGDSLVSHFQEKYSINVDDLLYQRCSTKVAQQNPDVDAVGN